MWKLAHESLGGTMRSIWTILLSVVVWIGRLAQQTAKAALIFLISVAMWLPMCLTANTAVAADSGTAATVANSNNSGNAADSGKAGKKAESNKSGDKPKSADKAKSADKPNAANKPNADVYADNANISAPSQPPVFVDGKNNAFAKLQNGVNNNLPNSAAKGDDSTNLVNNIFDSVAQSMANNILSQSSPQHSSLLNSSLRSSKNNPLLSSKSRLSDLRSSDRSSNDSNRFGSGREFRPGCDRNNARTECFTAPGDLQGRRATTGHDYDMNTDQAWMVNSSWNAPKGRYENNDNFVPYPKGTYLMRSIDNIIHGRPGDSWQGSGGQSPNRLPLDDVQDYVFMRRQTKPDGSGYIWDVLFNMGARVHGAADAWNYFTIPDNQELDASTKDPNTGEASQYIKRYKFNDNNIYGCKKDWVNPNGFCADVETKPVTNGQTIQYDWKFLATKPGGYFLSKDAATSVYHGGEQNKKDNGAFGDCNWEFGFDCVNSTKWGALSDTQRQYGPQIPKFDFPGLNNAYATLIKNLKNAVKNNSGMIFAFKNNIYDQKRIPYGYHIHFTTTSLTGRRDEDPFYGAGTYYGNRGRGTANEKDPYRGSNLALQHFVGAAKYRMLNNQWYGVPNLIDMFMPKYVFLRGTGTGPFDSDDGQQLAKNGLHVRSLMLNPVNQKVCDADYSRDCPSDATIYAKGELKLVPSIGKEGGYKRGNLWYRNHTGSDKVNTEDSSFGDHTADLQYINKDLGMGQVVSLPYKVIGQSDVFKPLETEEWKPDKPYKYYSSHAKFDAKDFINFPDKKSTIYTQAKARFPKLWMPDFNRKDYGSVKDNYYPLTEQFNNNNQQVNNDIKSRAIYDVSWAKEDGSDASQTLQDATAKIAVRLPVVDAFDPCNNSDTNFGRESKSVENKNRENSGTNRDARKNDLCSPAPVNGTERYIWRLYDAPKGGRIGDDLTAKQKADILQKAKNDSFESNGDYKIFERKGDHSTDRMILQKGGENSIQVVPVVVGVKYAKIIYYDDSRALMPVIFTKIDDEKPTIDVKVSVDGGEPQTVPESGLNVPVTSKIKFFVKGHDDRRISLGVKREDGRTLKYDDTKEVNDSFKSIVFNKFDQTSKGSVDTLTDKAGFLTNQDNLTSVDVSDVGLHTLTFHGWDDAGNEVQKTIKINVTSEGFQKPYVWWQKKDNGHYEGKVKLLPSSKNVKLMFVRIWKRGDAKPVDNNEDITNKCTPGSNSCYGIILHRKDSDKSGKTWEQLNSSTLTDDNFYKKLIKPLDNLSNPNEKITFEAKDGGVEVTIPERYAEIGSRIYVDISTGKGKGLTQDKTSSDPLPLDITFPNGMVQVNPYELNPSERHALAERIRANNERIKWRGDEIGFVSDGKNNGYKDGKNDPQGKYSCDVENDKQYKICLSLNPVQENTANGKRSTEKTLSVIKKTGIGNDNKDDQKQETVLDPTQKKITRFVDIRRDYDWSWNTGNTNHKNNLKDRDKDGGFKRYGVDGAQFLVYEYDINDKDFNTEDLLKALQGRVKKNVEGGRENQPSLYPMNTGEAGSITKGEIENSWNNGWNGLPARRSSNDGDRAYARCLLAKGNKCSSSNTSNRGEWVNIFDVVEVGGLGGRIKISSTGITDKSHVVQSQGYLMPGGSEPKFNKQESGHKIASVILNKDITTDKFATDLKRVQMYIFNGRPWEDLAVRGEGHTYEGYTASGNGRQLDTPNTINVWFVPVDKNRPWIERKNENSKILSGCLKDKDNPTQCDSNIESLDLDKVDLLKNPALFKIVDQLKLDDDFNKSADGGDSNKALKSRLWVDIVAEGVTDPKTGKAPRIRFVNGGVANNKVLKSFIYKWKGNNSKSATTFKLIAQTADDSGNKSGDEKSYETVVGMFKGNWKDATSPTVVAYDGSNAQKASTEATWLHTMKDAVKKSKDYHNGVLVRNSSNSTRTAIYYTTKPKPAKPKADKLNASKLQSADSEALESAASDPSTNSESYWNVLAICKKDGLWSVCEGYKPVDGSNINLDSKTGNVTFAQGFLAPGSVVRARSRIGIGPWTKMPGVKEQDVSSENYSHDSSTSNSADSLLNEKAEDVDDVILMDYASETPSAVCRADTIAAKTWLDGSHTSDCVFFPVNVSEKVVQVHPLLLTKSEKAAVDYVLRRDNAVNSVDDSSWSENLDDDSSNDTNKDYYSTGENKSIVTWVRLQYASSSKPEDKRPDYKAGDKQDSFILTLGWRSREVTPTPRYNHITRFATLRSVGKDAADSADYKVTWDEKKPYIGERSSDPGFELVGKPGHQSLVYRYNASTKGSQINLSQLQDALTLKPNIPNGMSEDEFKKIQPSLRVVSGADKENGEKSKQITVPLAGGKTRTDQFGNGSGFFTLNGEYINIPDLVLGNVYYGGGSTVRVSGTEGMDHATLGENYSNMSPKDIDIQKWCEGGDTANPNCKTVNSESFKLTKVLGGNKNIETADDVAGTSKQAIAPVYALSLSNGWAMNSLKNTYGYDAQTHFKNVASAPSLIPVYVVPVDVIKPKAESIGSLQKSTMSKPYEVTANDIKFTFTGNPDSKGKVSGKELLVDASDDFDSRDVVEKNLQVCVRWMNNNMPQDKDCTPILKRDTNGNASVDAEALQQMLVTHGNTAVYAVYAQTKDQSENESVGYDESKEKAPIIGYIKITGINVLPVPLPFTGGQAAVIYTFMFGVLLALFIASGAFGRRGWLASVLSGNGISGELTYSKHCNASSEPLRCSRLFGIIYKNRH